MNMWRVGEDMGSKETDGCPLTLSIFYTKRSGHSMGSPEDNGVPCGYN
jgi:hypothetical protein